MQIKLIMGGKVLGLVIFMFLSGAGFLAVCFWFFWKFLNGSE